jgi:hypothetical protein
MGGSVLLCSALLRGEQLGGRKRLNLLRTKPNRFPNVCPFQHNLVETPGILPRRKTMSGADRPFQSSERTIIGYPHPTTD